MSKNDFMYIRNAYKVPARPGMEVNYRGKKAVIKGARNGRLIMRVEGDDLDLHFHPTWEIEYPEAVE